MNTPYTIRLNAVRNRPGLSSVEVELHDENDRYLRTIRLTDQAAFSAARLLCEALGLDTGQAVQVMPPVLEGEVVDGMAVLFDKAWELFPAVPSGAVTAGCAECAAEKARLGPGFVCELHFGGWD